MTDARTRRGTGPHRDEAARQAVLNAADNLLAEAGFDGVTMEAVAQRAGVAKQTVYRWWKSKVDILYDNLIEDAAEYLVWPGPSGPEGYSAEDLRGYLSRFVDFLEGEREGPVLRVMLGHAQLYPHTAKLLEEGLFSPLRERDAANLCQVFPGLTAAEAEQALDDLFAPLFHRSLVRGVASDAVFLDRHVQLVTSRLTAGH